jgi:hypothetical protein
VEPSAFNSFIKDSLQDIFHSRQESVNPGPPHCLFLFLAGCGGGDPFQHASVSGKVTYEDGSPIVADVLTLMFHPQATPIDAKTHPRPGVASVNKDGTFSSATTHKANDGLVRGKHKVILVGINAVPLPPSIVPAE